MKKQRALELEQLLQKYQNIKKDLETQNTLELKKLQKHPGTSFSTSTSRVLTSRSGTRKGKPKKESPISMPSEI